MSDRLLIDLQELVTETADLRLPDGTMTVVEPPALEDFLELAKLHAEASEADETDATANVADLFKRMRAEIVRLVPALEPYKLNMQQMIRIIMSLQQMCFPEDVAELEKMGITLTDDQKKVVSPSSKK